MSCRVILQIFHEAAADWEPYICIWCDWMWHFSSDDVSSPASRCYIYFTVLMPITPGNKHVCLNPPYQQLKAACVCMKAVKRRHRTGTASHLGFLRLISSPTRCSPSLSWSQQEEEAEVLLCFLRTHWCKWCFLIVVTALPRAVFSVSHSWQRCF